MTVSKKFLGIDYGTKRIGLAINVLSLVEPLMVLENHVDELSPIASPTVLEQIVQVCQKRAIDEIVLGLSEAAMAEKIKLFATALQVATKLKIHLMDETLSSHEVGQRMKEAHLKLKKRQGPIDHFAAAVILEEFLEMNL